ncbi:suppressor APC domain-containing protein 1 [Dermochelys coriacea]|uniref:suppressor APC domain-containing protein 1 n=1 Tax=Dermochelys coriacea TaxID=27794 RepID=UPI001CA975D8|nr:suppressor APC domain-containing protein 1 [Dermochelys coriacea]
MSSLYNPGRAAEWGCAPVGDREPLGPGGPGPEPPGGPQHELLPPGVLPALQQVAGPSGGFLSFPRLVAGLRIALLRDQEEEQGPGAEAAETGHNSAQERTSGGQTREGEPRGVTRSRSINSALSQAGQPRSLRVPKEPRRHTITHGIDYGALQRRQARERERDALLQGLDLAERLRGWYRRHLLEAQRRQEQGGGRSRIISRIPAPIRAASCWPRSRR